MAEYKNSYAEKLKDPRWQRKRLDILQRDEFTCQSCGDKTTTLHVHHLHYFPNKEPWDISEDYLITLCEICHLTEGETYKDELHDLILILKSKRLLSFDIHSLSAILLESDLLHTRFNSETVKKLLVNER